MALTDEQLEIISDALIPLFQYLESQVIIDVANRIKESLAYTRTAELKVESMQRMGYSPVKIRNEALKILNADSDFRKMVAENTLEHKKKVKEILQSIMKSAQAEKDDILAKAADLSYFDDLGVWNEAGKTLTDSSFLAQLVDVMRKQTSDTFKNLTGTTGFKTMSGFEAMENLYRRELDKAMIKVCTGTYTREQVVYDVVHSLAGSGLRTIDFSSGKSMQLDTAVKLAIRTGAHQLSGKITDKNIDQTGENLVRVSKHWGARNTESGHANHEQWQGKVYFIKDGTDYAEEAKRIGQDGITSLWHATGYSADGSRENDPLGLYGYNCRHRHYVWFEGISVFPDEDPEPAPVTIDGKKYDYYAISQRQRSNERAIRALKREREAMKALDMDTTEVTKKIRQRIREYNEFCDVAKVKPDFNRLRYEAGTSDLKKTEAWKKYRDAVDVGEFKEYRVIGYKGAQVTINDRIDIANRIKELPKSVRSALNDVTFCLHSEIGGGYWKRKNKIYYPTNIGWREFYHEIGHRIEDVLLDENEVDNLKKKLVQGLTERDIIKIKGKDSVGNVSWLYAVDSHRFIDEYQGRLYVEKIEDALLPDGSINTAVLGEVISVAVERFFTTPDALKKNFPDMYKLLEDAISE